MDTDRRILLLTLIVVLFSFVSGNQCNVSHISECYSTLVHYEGLGFPLYGEDEVELDKTCMTINDSFDCLDSYLQTCLEQPECDNECAEMIADIGIFKLNTGLRDLQTELCNPVSAMRETYLENYVCLEDNADYYAKCHNDSQLSQEYMASLTVRAEALYARCCFFTWYQDCFTNITREKCGDNATFVVSFSLHKLIGHIADQLCRDSDVFCNQPPMKKVDADDLTPNPCENEIEPACGSTSFMLFSPACLLLSILSAVLLKHMLSIK